MDKKQTAILVVVLVLVASAIVVLLMGDNFIDNEPIHQHEYSANYTYDDNQHWYSCECGAKTGKADHNLIDAKCECGYQFNLEGHECEYKVLKSDSEEHWYQCACGQKQGVMPHKGGTATCLTKANCTVCGATYGETLQHEYKTQSFNQIEHWYECVCGLTSTPKKHDFSYGKCDCGYRQTDMTHVCNFNMLKKDELKHWYECECGLKSAPENHKGGTATCLKQAKCEECGKLYGQTKTHDYTELKKNGLEYWFECICGDKSAILQGVPKE